jgi:hypothetical protein
MLIPTIIRFAGLAAIVGAVLFDVQRRIAAELTRQWS